MIRPKLIYFAERHPDLDPAGFARRWREHGELGMRLKRWANVARYTQGLPLPFQPEDAEPLVCDGVATVTFRSEEARLRHVADPEGRITKADEGSTFARPVRTFALLTDPIPVVAGAAAATALFIALRRKPSTSAAVFAHRWSEAMAAEADRLTSDAPHPTYVQNMRRLDTAAHEGFEADCIDELYAADLPTAWRAYRSAVQRSGACELIAHLRVAAVRQTVLHDDHALSQA